MACRSTLDGCFSYAFPQPEAVRRRKRTVYFYARNLRQAREKGEKSWRILCSRIYEALGKIDNGGAMVADLQEAISKTRNEAAASRIDRNKVLDALGLRDTEVSAGGLEASLAGLGATLAALKQFGTPEGLGKELGTLQKQVKELADKYEASEKKAAEERDKRIAQAIEAQLTAAFFR